VDQLAAYLRAPSPASSADAQYVILQAGPTIRAAQPDATPERALRLQAALADLHSIYTSLLDQMPPADQPSGESHGAA